MERGKKKLKEVSQGGGGRPKRNTQKIKRRRKNWRKRNMQGREGLGGGGKEDFTPARYRERAS